MLMTLGDPSVVNGDALSVIGIGGARRRRTEKVESTVKNFRHFVSQCPVQGRATDKGLSDVAE